jgi:PhoH-like ATPase
VFVLDTNVVLYDYTCIYNFEEHDVVIPIVVLEEVDVFKKGSDSINFQAREFIRELDKLSKDQLFRTGVKLSPQHGRLFVEVGHPRSELIERAFAHDKADHRILALADQLRHSRKDVEVILITKDISLRMKAKSLGIPAEDYETGKIRNIDALYTGVQMYEHFDTNLIRRFYETPYHVPIDDLRGIETPLANEYFIFKNHSSSVLTHFNPLEKTFERVVKKPAYAIDPRNAEQVFALDALLRPEVPVVTLTGKAGTGKTLLALAAALQQRQLYSQIYLARPIVPLSNRDIGYLPGDVQSKLDPYMQPLYDNLAVIKNRFGHESPERTRINEMVQNEKLVITPLAYIRGRSLDRIFFIVDEAQNLTPHEIKTILTRAGEGTKMVFAGDIYQIDSPYLDSQSNGLTYLVDRMKGQELFAHVNLVKGERSALAELASNLL